MAATNTNKVIIKGMVITSTGMSSGLLSFSSSEKESPFNFFGILCIRVISGGILTDKE